MRASSSIPFVFSGFPPADAKHGDELCKTCESPRTLWLHAGVTRPEPAPHIIVGWD
jgi:hypothetical protein